jgi:DNA-directed RNA polymerase subunit F
MSDNDKAAKKAAADAKKAEELAKLKERQLAYFNKMQALEAEKAAADKARMNDVDGGGKAKKMRRSRRKSLRKTRQRNRKRHGRKSRRRL